MRPLPILCLVATAACTPLAEIGDDDTDTSDTLYEPGRVIDVAITMDPGDFTALRSQTRDPEAIFGPDGPACFGGPVAKVFTYFEATVEIDDEVIGPVGVRKKGFLGSLDEQKPSLKIKISEYVEGQRFRGQKKITLNNSIQDRSLIHQCLGYQLFAAAGVPSSRCNFARVSVNGEDLGVYVNVEGIDKRYLGRRFGDNDGNLYEGNLADFRDGWIVNFERKTNEEDADRADLDAVAAAVAGADPLAALESVVDVDGFYSFWAIESLVGHFDGYAGNTNNYYVYFDPETGRASFLPWGIDMILGPPPGVPPEEFPIPPIFGRSSIPVAILTDPAGRAAFADRYREIVDQVWDETALLAEVDRMEALIGRDAGAIDAVRDFVEGRRAAVEAMLESGLPPNAELSPGFCM
jgi:hypothetical protein